MEPKTQVRHGGEDVGVHGERGGRLQAVPPIAAHREPNMIMALTILPVSGVAYVLWCAGMVPGWFHLPAMFATALLVNSLAHDSLHGNVSRHRWLNDGVGWLCSFLAGLPRNLHARAHGLHHGAPMTARDPHLWMHTGPTILLPLRWLTANFGYYRVLPELPARQLPVVGVVVVLYVGLIAADPSHTLLSWVLPMQLSTFLFALFTDWLPHGRYGEVVEADEAACGEVHRRFHAVTMWHQDHHRRPRLPFYQGPKLLESRLD